MRTLVVGAGAIGGYFGGRLLEANHDITFLVRPRRAAELASSGLIIRSRFGDVNIPTPKTILAEDLKEHFGLILLSCKAYDLENAITSLAPAVGADTAILPLLNGMRHMDVLDARFGPARVLGGQCLIAATLNDKREIAHLNENHDLTFGERDGSHSARIEAITTLLSGARFAARRSEAILQEMWEKWVFIATAAGITCLMRSAIGDIVAAGAADLASTLLDECAAIAAQQGFSPSAESLQRIRAMLTKPGSGLTASMLRDVERNAPTEGDHIIGDLFQRGEKKHLASPLLRIAYAHLKAYDARRNRGTSTGKTA
ncbi:MAG TPA: 2-dehydropantoate 2-reductase [Candidatus Angelobacter sp.]|nr:2-dehydropantoate 2-reductase [Candidatus Angelobacter sp.]